MAQDLVAYQMSMAIVDSLEVVDVDHQESEFFIVALGVLDGVLQFRHEGGVVEQSGEPVLVDHLPYTPAAFGPRDDHLQQQVDALVDRLGQEIVRPGSECLDVTRDRAPRGQEHDR